MDSGEAEVLTVDGHSSGGAGQSGTAGSGVHASIVGHAQTPRELASVSKARTKPSKERLAYLDGLRGALCVVVVLHHFLCAFWPCLIFGQSTSWLLDLEGCPGDSQALLWVVSHAAPVYSGKFSVVVFYVLSGLVLSHQMLQESTADVEMSQRQRAWAIAVAKRYFRLSLPCAAASIFAYALAGSSIHSDAAEVTGSRWLQLYCARRPLPFGLLQQVVWGTMFVGSTLNNAMWSMRMELFGSLLVYMLVAVIVGGGNTEKVRRRVLIAALLFCLGSSGTLRTDMQASILWNSGNASVPLSAPFWRDFLHNRTATFRSYEAPRHELGDLPRRPPTLIDKASDTQLLSESLSLHAGDRLDIVVESNSGWVHTAPLTWYAPFIIGVGLSCTLRSDQQRPSLQGSWWACICTALVCASYPFSLAPRLVQRNMIFEAMSYCSGLLMLGDTGDVFWYMIGAASLIHTVLASPLFQKALVLRPVAWLGRVSFGLYLTHIPILYTVTCHIFLYTLSLGVGYGSAAGLACCLSFAIMLLLAEMFTKFVDQPAIRHSGRIGKWLVGEG